MPDDLKLSGSGLETELPEFLSHLASAQPRLAAIFTQHLPILREASTDDTRRVARAQFNSAVKASLLADNPAIESNEN